MRDPRIEKLAEMVVNYSAEVKPGQKVYIKGGPAAQPMLLAVYQKVLEAGAFPFMVPTISGAQEVMYRYASDEQLSHLPDPLMLIAETYDAYINVIGEDNTKGLSSVAGEKNVLYQKANSRFSNTIMDRAARNELNWSLTLFPTFAHAQDAEMSLSDYEDFVYGACMPDMNDPIGYWRKVSKKQDKIVDWLKGKKDIHVTGKETDLTLSIENRVFVNCDCHKNIPDGEVFTGPVESSVNGRVCFSYPAIYQGREVTGVRLWFENGKVVKAAADKNEEFLLKMLDTDAGSRYVGEFAIGTNEGINRFTGQILFDEKIGGSFHMALGKGYPETGNTNPSAIHWDMICDLRAGGKITADGNTFYQNGKFILDL
jgi:aminopeptidase